MTKKSVSACYESAQAQVTRSDRKVAQAIHGRSARAITHLIHEVRPLSGQRFALFKNAWRFCPGRAALSSSDRVICALSLFVAAKFILL